MGDCLVVEPRWLDEEEIDAWRNLSLMQLQLGAFLSRSLANDGLSYQDYLVMADLSDRPDDQARLNELGHRLGWEKSRVSHHISRMQKRGLVAKTRCPTDRRGWFVTLTDHGRAAIARAAPAHVDAVCRQFIDLLTPEQLDTLNTVAQTVLANLPEEDG